MTKKEKFIKEWEELDKEYFYHLIDLYLSNNHNDISNNFNALENGEEIANEYIFKIKWAIISDTLKVTKEMLSFRISEGTLIKYFKEFDLLQEINTNILKNFEYRELKSFKKLEKILINKTN